MKSLFLICTPLYDYHRQISGAFRQIGYECDVSVYRIPNKYIMSVPFLKSYYIKLFYKKENNRIQAEILRRSYINHILFFGMCEFPYKQLKKIKDLTGARLVFWFIDSIIRHKKFFEAIPLCDLAFAYKVSDCEFFDKNIITNCFLPLFFDSATYYPIEEKKEIDIFFIGALKSRIDFLNDLSRGISHLKLNIGFYGKLSPLFVLLNRSKYKWFFKYHRNKSLNHQEINRFYNQAALCINLQPIQATDALNIRTFEVYGSGGLLVTDGSLDLISQYFRPGEDIIHFTTIDNLTEIVLDFFGSQKLFNYGAIIQNIRSSSKIKHSLIERIKAISEQMAQLS